MSAARLASGTLYPLLLRFEKAGVLISRWEDGRPEDLGRPRRRFYRMTPAGRGHGPDRSGSAADQAAVRPHHAMVNGRQYLVVAISGGSYSGELLAFRLP